MKFFSYICKCVALDTGMCDIKVKKKQLLYMETLYTFAV